MKMDISAEAVARQLVAEYNKGSPDWVEACHVESTEWIELPFLGGSGRSGGRAELRQAAELQVVNFPDRRMEILNIVAGGDQAALEVEWTGTAAQQTAWAAKGAKLKLRGSRAQNRKRQSHAGNRLRHSYAMTCDVVAALRRRNRLVGNQSGFAGVIDTLSPQPQAAV